MAQTELTRMFASLGFKVDDTGAAQFESRLRTLRENSAMFARNLGVVANKLTLVKKKVDALNRSLASDSKSSKSKNNKGMSESYSRLANYVERVEQSHKSITTHEPVLVKALNNIRTTVWKGSNAWEAYRKNVSSANNEMRSFKQSMADMRRGTGSVAVNNKYYGGNQTSPRPSVAHPPQSPTSAGGAMMFGALGGGVKDFFRSMTPATAIAGGLVSAGFAAKEVVQRGREMTKMNNVLLMAASGQEQYAEALQFVNKESHRLGQSTQELGMAFGKVLQSARGKMKYEDIEKVFTGFGELMTAMGANVDDQKGIYRAFGQMLTKGKIEAEEEGQMAERGLPAKELIKQSAMEVYGVDSAGYEKMRQKGAVKVEDIAVNLSNRMRAMANNNDALNKMLQTSGVAQQRFMNAIDKLSQTIMKSGLDKGLFYIFSGLAKIVEVLDPTVKGFGLLTKGVWDFGVGVKNLASAVDGRLVAALAGALLLILKFTKAGKEATDMSKSFTKQTSILSGKHVVLAGKIVRTTAVTWALFEALSALEKSNSGEVNWVTLLGAQFGVLFSFIDLASARVEHFFSQLRYYAKNPVEFFGGDSNSRVSNLIPGIGVLKYAKNALRYMEDRFNPKQEPDKDRFPASLKDVAEEPKGRVEVNVNLRNEAGRIVGNASGRLGDLQPLTLTQP